MSFIVCNIDLKMLKKYLFFIALFLVVSFTSAQRKAGGIDPQDYQYKYEYSFGARIQTNGISLSTEFGWIKDLYRTRILQLEYTYYIDYRQKVQKSTQGGRNYLFGFQNKFHEIHLSYGIKRTIADKANRNGVRLSFIFFGGVSLGLLKPYYLDVYQQVDTAVPTIEHIRYSAETESVFLDKSIIVGASPIRYGLNQMQPVAGLHSKSGLNFDWGTKDQFVKALEAGIAFDLYYKRLPIMVNNSNRFYQLAFYVSFHFGKRW